MPGNARSSWRHILVAVGAGFAVASQVGKVPAALPALGEEFELSLYAASWIVSTFRVRAAITGVYAGGLAQRVGAARAAVLGLLICAVGGFAGAQAASFAALLTWRVVEGLGFIVSVTALPSLVAAHASVTARPVALGLWGGFLPGGMSIMLLASPWWLGLHGWRGVWQLTASVLLLAAGVVWWTFRHEFSAAPARPAGAGVLRIVARRGPLLLGACFGAYSAQFIAVTSFLPTLLMQDYGASVTTAASIGALVVAANVSGNVTAGWLMRRGVPGRRIMMLAACVMALSTSALFADVLPVFVRIAFAVVFSVVGGLLPGALFASTPGYAAHLAQVAVLSGLLLQLSAIGQVLGPPLLSLTVERLGGWSSAPAFSVSAALLGVLFAALLPRGESNPR